MPYLYHQKPSEMEGEVLYSLSYLREKHVNLFDREAKKYKNREALMEEKIPLLGCLWGDVVFASPLDPRAIFTAMKSAGLNPDPTKLWYKIPVSEIGQYPMAWYSYSKQSEKDDFRLRESDVALFCPEEYRELEEVPREAVDYYREVAQRGDRPFLFHLIPHVFIKGPVDISRSEVISWADPV